MHWHKGPKGYFREHRWLACYPGSGSKHLIRLLNLLTGAPFAGSVDGLRQFILGQHFMVKTHHQPRERWRNAVYSDGEKDLVWTRFPADLDWRLDNVAMGTGKGILLIRNPYRYSGHGSERATVFA